MGAILYCIAAFLLFKGIVHFEIKIWYLSAYPKGIRCVTCVCACSGLVCASAGSDLLRRLSQSARTHVTHRMRVRTQITWTWLCTRGKKQYKYCSFSHTNRSFRVLGHQCVVTMGNCLIWISLCMFFFPLIETVTYTCHYMTDRLERFDLKISKLDLLKKKRHLHLGCPWGCQGSVVCHLFLPLVSIFGLFPVLVSCHYELSMFQLCLSHYVLITLCI